MDVLSFFNIDFWRRLGSFLPLKLWAIAKILLFVLILRFVAHRLIDRVLVPLVRLEVASAAARARTLRGLLRSVVFYVLVFVTAVMILRVFEVDPAPVLTAAGVVGLAVGFGAQKLVRDIISGFFIVLENQYSIGDYVTIGGITGVVEDFGMRVTTIRDDNGKFIILPNGDISAVMNHSRGPIRAVLEVSVAPDSNLDIVRTAVRAAGEEVARLVEGVVSVPEVDAVTAVDSSRITLRVVGEVRAGRQEAVQSGLREAIRAEFAQRNIRLV